EWYMHPNGQLPAYEWAFGDVNPPVHGWATWRVYKIDEKLQGKGDRKFLEEVFHKLLLNFTWWVNKKDHTGGFLGMDNIGVFDRSAQLPTGGYIEQSDGTSWMAMFTLNMMRMALELAKENSTYQSLATKFFEHFLYIAGAIANEGIDLWDEEDEFFYDVLHTPDNRRTPMKIRSMVGLIPLFAVEVLDEELFKSMPEFTHRLEWFLQNRPDLAGLISRWGEKGKNERHLLSLLRGHRMKKLLKRMLDESEFLSPYGIRALSKVYDEHPFRFYANGNEFSVRYTPGEGDTALFGGNSNWRGPVWFPVNYLLIESLQRFHHYYGDDFKVEHPTGSGNMRTLQEIADDISQRMKTQEDVMSHSQFTSPELNDFNFAHRLEWIETNGLGGYASSTVSGAHSRRYHGLLVAAMHPPVGRTLLLSKLDETIVTDGKRFELSSNQYPGAVHPNGFQYLKSFGRELFPEFVYEAEGIQLRKTIAAVQGENTTLIIYEVLAAERPFQMELMPLTSSRDYHSVCHANNAIDEDYNFGGGVFRTKNYPDSPELFISVPGSSFIDRSDWYHNLEFAIEHYRGLEYQEDLFSHGKFLVNFKKGDTIGVIVSTQDPSGRDAIKLFHQERERKESLLKPYREKDENIGRLILAADQFIVKRGNDLKTIIAGYHWFSDWGRDTMIALPGLCLVTGRFDDAKKILKAFSNSVSQGMLPNRFPDHGEVPEYNTIDATLWYFNAVYKYYQYSNDKSFVIELIPILKDIIDWHYKGTRYNIHVDKDELLYGGEEGVQLTWMDAKVGDWVVTPRRGKAVEINALWYNALCIMHELLTIVSNESEAADFKRRASLVQANFNLIFWNEQQSCLYDFVDDEVRNADVRPNQIYAVSLPFPVLSKDRSELVLSIVTEKLLTTRGLRSLSPDSKEYKPVYGGDRWSRDGAYHQGTVWSFLIGPYIDALILVEGMKGKSKAKEILATFFEHLNEVAVGSVSEIFDGEPPHHARGCISQAWGVGEVLRVATEHSLFN
ncbi:hypothetical protein FGG08_007551, partial [Glutinoglossum americanum]